MRVGEVARRTGLSVRMVRYYEERGLLPAQARTPGRHRTFDETDVRWLQAMTTLRAAGVDAEVADRALRSRLVDGERDQVQQQLEDVAIRVRATQALLRPADTGADPVEQRISLGFDIFLLRERIETLMSAALARTGMSSGEYAVLSLVVFESLTPAALTRLVGVAPSTLARRLRVLIDRGWVVRRPNPAHPRSWVLEITDACRAQIRRGLPIAERVLEDLEADLRRSGIDPDGFRSQVQTASRVVRGLLP